jgi:hypothetical protein
MPRTRVTNSTVGVELPGRGCQSYAPGHNIHVIQAREAFNQPGAIGVLVAEGDEVSLLTEDATLRLRCHRPERLQRLAEDFSHLEWEYTCALILPARREGLRSVPTLSVAAGARELSDCQPMRRAPARRTG